MRWKILSCGVAGLCTSLLIAAAAAADDKVLIEWRFDRNEDLRGWQPGGEVGDDQVLPQGRIDLVQGQGGIGGGHFTPIVNKPEVAILGMGRGVVRAVVRGADIVQRTMLPLSLSYDHRIIDGADAARFMVDLVSEFENFPEADVRLSS